MCACLCDSKCVSVRACLGRGRYLNFRVYMINEYWRF